MTNSTLSRLILTVIAHDKPGIVNKIAKTVRDNGGNWLESSMTNLRGHFAGVLLIEAPESRHDALLAAIKDLESADISIASTPLSQEATQPPLSQEITLKVEANDREGIIEEISHKLAENHVNVNKMETWLESAPMAGYELFHAEITVGLSDIAQVSELESVLESVSDDLMVSVS